MTVPINCPVDTDDYGYHWPPTLIGNMSTQPCSQNTKMFGQNN